MNRVIKNSAVFFLCGMVLSGIAGFTVSCHKPGRETEPAVQKVIYHCPMHPNYLSDKPGDCPICGMKLVPVSPGGGGKNLPAGKNAGPGKEKEAGGQPGTVRIDPAVVQNMGVTTETVMKRNLTKEIRASTVIDLNETAVSIINTKTMGWAEKLYVDYTGQQVKKGQALLDIYSPDLVSTQEEYLQSVRYLKSLPEGTSPDARKGAEELVASARRRLLNWDIPESEIAALEVRGAAKRTMTLHAPSDGVVLEKMVVTGQNLMPGMELYKIANLSTVWAVASVYQDDLPFVKVGMAADIAVQAVPGRTFGGRVSFVAPVLDMTSRTAAVRIEVRNTPDLQLKPQMFASVTMRSPVRFSAVAVPEQAVIRSGTRAIVILALGNGYFRPVEVTPGISAGGYVQIIKGIAEGQTIVTSSQFLIDSESSLKTAVSQMQQGASTDTIPGPSGSTEAMPGMEKMNQK